MGQEVQVRISDINTDNNTVNLSMVPAGAYDDRSGGYGETVFFRPPDQLETAVCVVSRCIR